MVIGRLRFMIAMGSLVVASALVTGCDSAVYRAAEKGDIDALVAMAEDATEDEYSVRTVAVEQLGELGTPAATDALLAWLEEGPPPGLEDDVLAALGATGDPRAIEPLLAELAASDRTTPAAELGPEQELRLWMLMRGLANLPDSRVAEALLAELDAGHAAAISEVELADALAGQGQSIVAALEQRLASSDELVFVPAARALTEIYSARGDNARVAELLTSPATFRIYEGVLHGSGSAEKQAMIDSLNTVGDVRMAQHMLNSDVEEYEEAAEAWAAAHGYTIESWFSVE